MAEVIRHLIDWHKLYYQKMECLACWFICLTIGVLKYISGSLIYLGFMGEFMEMFGRFIEAGFVAAFCAICAGAGTYAWNQFKKKYLIKDKRKKRKQ